MTVEKKGRTAVERRSNGGETTVERRSNDGTMTVQHGWWIAATALKKRMRPTIRRTCPHQTSFQRRCDNLLALSVAIQWYYPRLLRVSDGITTVLKKAQEQACNSKSLLHSACSEASICKIHPTQAMVVTACSFPAPYSTVLCCAHPVRTLVTASM